MSNAQSILRTGLDVDYGARTGLSRRNMIHFCVATNQRPLKRQGLHCYLDLKVANWRPGAEGDVLQNSSGCAC